MIRSYSEQEKLKDEILRWKAMPRRPSRIRIDRPHRWYSDYLDNLPVGIYRSTVEGKFVYVNMRMAKMFGFETTDELLGFPVIDLYLDKKDRGTLIQEIMTKGHVEDVSMPFKNKNGTLLWCSVTARPVFDDDNIMVYLDGVIKDITKGEEENSQNQGYQDTGINFLNDLVIILNLDGEIININKAGITLLGLQKSSLIGKPIIEFIAENDRDTFPLFLSSVVETGRQEGILVILDRKGSEHYIELHAIVVKQKGINHHIRCIARDVTQKIKEQAERLSREKFQGVLEMAGGVAHKINQPLTIINNLINEVLSDLEAESKPYENMTKIHNQINKLNDIAKKIRGISRYEAMDYVGGIKIVDIDKAS